MAKILTPKQAIAAKCKDCIYDCEAAGTWRQQTHACTITDCPLWMLRPRSKTPFTAEQIAASEAGAAEPTAAVAQTSLLRPIATPKRGISGRSKR